MRLALLLPFLLLSALYTGAAWRSYREELSARGGTEMESARHPEANLRVLRTAIENDEYSDRLLPYLDRALAEAPSFYQPPFLMAALYANRLERPDLVRRSFEAALERFPSNGRLHLTYAEWLLTPRASAPYRAFREEARPDSRELALDRIESAAALEPDLTGQALNLMLRFRVPVAAWAERLPRSEETNVLILDAFDRASADASVRAQTLRAFVESATTVELLRRASLYAERWGEGDLALEAVGKWREAALQAGDAREIVLAAAAGARRRLESDDPEAAYRLLRETLSAMEERKLPTERSQELLCLVAEEYRRRRLNAMAQGLYSEAVTLSPGYAPAHLGLARTYRDQGDLASASQELERVLQLDSTNEVAARELEQIAKLAAGRR